MTATARLTIPQADLCIWEAYALAEILGKPNTRHGCWIFAHEVAEEPVSYLDDEEEIARHAWESDRLQAIAETFDAETAERLDALAEITCELSEDEHRERIQFEREAA